MRLHNVLVSVQLLGPRKIAVAALSFVRPGTLPSMGNPLFTHRDDSCTAALRRSRQFRIVSRIFAKLYIRPTNYRDCLIKSVPSANCIDL